MLNEQLRIQHSAFNIPTLQHMTQIETRERLTPDRLRKETGMVNGEC